MGRGWRGLGLEGNPRDAQGRLILPDSEGANAFAMARETSPRSTCCVVAARGSSERRAMASCAERAPSGSWAAAEVPGAIGAAGRGAAVAAAAPGAGAATAAASGVGAAMAAEPGIGTAATVVAGSGAASTRSAGAAAAAAACGGSVAGGSGAAVWFATRSARSVTVRGKVKDDANSPAWTSAKKAWWKPTATAGVGARAGPG